VKYAEIQMEQVVQKGPSGSTKVKVKRQKYKDRVRG